MSETKSRERSLVDELDWEPEKHEVKSPVDEPDREPEKHEVKSPVDEPGREPGRFKMKHRAVPGQDGKTSDQRQIQYTIDNEALLPAQRNVLKRYDQECDKNNGLSISGRLSQLSVLSLLARKVRKPWKEMTKEDIENYIFGLELAHSSMDTHKIYIRKFFKWLYKSKDFPEIVEWITLQKNRKRKLPDDILTPGEIKMMIDAAGYNLRDRALISVLYESGCRLGEIAGVKLKDVTSDQYGIVIIVHGKTGDRRIRLIDSVPDLTQWMNVHPNRDGDKPLFVHERNAEKPLEEKGIYLTVRKLAKKAGITKRVHPHLFRHTRSTHLAKDFTDSELKIMQGWTPGSRMTEIYVHLSGADIDNKRLEKAGLLTRDEARKEDDSLKARVCPRCRTINPSTARFCPKCGMALDIETSVKIDTGESGMALELMDLMQREPRLLEMLKNVTPAGKG
uniref:Putative site-specific tyrosine recombinase n=1 Tax=viral metagenome TaxID=1070528 RepID=A0A6M3Y1X5_9ZZZZ